MSSTFIKNKKKSYSYARFRKAYPEYGSRKWKTLDELNEEYLEQEQRKVDECMEGLDFDVIPEGYHPVKKYWADDEVTHPVVLWLANNTKYDVKVVISDSKSSIFAFENKDEAFRFKMVWG